MTPDQHQWVFSVGTLAALTGVVLFIIYLAVSLFHLRQTHFTPMRLITEGLKFVGAVLLLLTLLQPEIHTRTSRHENARIGVIVDETDSMLTQDIRQPGETLTRKAYIERLMASEAWAELQEEVDLEILRVGHDANPVMKETDLTSGLARARELDQLAAVLVLSDGLHNVAESPLPEILRLAEAEVPSFAVEVGESSRLPDLVLEEVDFPSYSIMNEDMVLPVRVSSSLPGDTPAQLVLMADGRPVARTEVLISNGDREDASLRWTPRTSGPVELTVEVETHPDEHFPENNRQVATVDVRKTLIRVLLIDSLPRWEFRYLRNALYRDPGVHVDSLLLHPELGPQGGPGYLSAFPVSRDAWSSYDVVFLGDVGLGQGELKPEDLRNLESLVREQGSGLVFLPGARGGHFRLRDTPLESLMPVEYDDRFPRGFGLDLEMRLSLTREGRDHLLTQLASSSARNQQIWRSLPGFYWYAPVARARVGSEVLATHASRRNENGRIPLLATRNAGTGHVLFLGTDGAWRWRKGVEDLYHYRFWGQVVRWMAHKRHMFGDDGARVFIQPERPEVGQEVTATISLRGAMALSDDVPFRLRIENPAGEVISPAVTALEGGGTYQASWIPELPGESTLELLPREEEGDAWFTTTFKVEGDVPEQRGIPMRSGLLRELAQVTGGDSVSIEDANDLLVRLKDLPKQQTVLTVNRLWQNPLWVTLVFVFFGLYWILRKRQGWI